MTNTQIEQCTGHHIAHTPQRSAIGMPGRLYTICMHDCSDVPGAAYYGNYCGRLIDVTDMPVIRVNTCCGEH